MKTKSIRISQHATSLERALGYRSPKRVCVEERLTNTTNTRSTDIAERDGEQVTDRVTIRISASVIVGIYNQIVKILMERCGKQSANIKDQRMEVIVEKEND
ncbi:MAG: hypothetical protein ACTSUE_13995 [Promethearchaeota archaeon]